MSDIDRKFWRKLREQANRTLGESFWNDMSSLLPSHQPRTDMYQTPEHLVVVIELPGWNEERDSLKLSVHKHTLHIRGDIPYRYSAEEDDLLLSERFFGSFHRKIALPPDTAAAGMKAVYENGLLTVQFHRSIADDTPVDIEIRGTNVERSSGSLAETD